MDSSPESEPKGSSSAGPVNNEGQEVTKSPDLEGIETVEFQRSIATLPWILTCTGLYLGALLYGLDTTIAADVQGSILESLGEIEKLAWVGIGFPMGSVATILLIGTCYGLFEIKYLMISSIVLFETGSAICGGAPSMNAMIVGRIVAGIGGAGIYLGALNYISIFTSLKERALYNALIGLCWGVGCILGPLIGGGFADSSATWRWAFYINLPLAALFSPVYIWVLPKHNPKLQIPALQKLATIDWVGAVLNAATFSLFIIALTSSGSILDWGSAGSIALWAVFGVTLIAFILQSSFSIFTTPERRLFPVQFLKSRTMILLYFVTASAATGLAVTIYYVPLFFEFTKGDSAIQAAVRLLPFIALMVAFTMLSGALLPVFGHYMPWYIPGSIFLIVGGTLMSLISPTTKTAAIYGFEILIATGSGLTAQIGYSVAAAKVSPDSVPTAIGFINVAQIGTIAIALSLSGSLFQNVGFRKLSSALAGYGFDDAALRDALAGAQSTILQQGSETVVELAIEAVVSTISRIFILIITAGAVMLVSAVFMKRERLQLNHAAAG